MVQKCNECQRHSNKNSRPPERQISATHPMEILGMDLVNFRGQHALIKVDYYSGFLTYDTLVDKTIDAVTAALKYIDITKAQTTYLDTSVSNILTSSAELFYSRRTNMRLSMAPAHLKPMKRDNYSYLPNQPIWFTNWWMETWVYWVKKYLAKFILDRQWQDQQKD